MLININKCHSVVVCHSGVVPAFSSTWWSTICPPCAESHLAAVHGMMSLCYGNLVVSDISVTPCGLCREACS